RARTVARSLAEAVERTRSRRPEDVVRVATWRLLTGGGRPEVLLAGATVARWRHELALAERLARAALERGSGFDAALLAAHLAALRGRRAEAEQQLAALAHEEDGDARRARTAIARFDNTLAGTGGDARGVLVEARRTVRD